MGFREGAGALPEQLLLEPEIPGCRRGVAVHGDTLHFVVGDGAIEELLEQQIGRSLGEALLDNVVLQFLLRHVRRRKRGV